MADDTLNHLRSVLNLPIGDIECVFVNDLAVVLGGKLVGAVHEFGTASCGGRRPYLLGKS